MSRNSISTTQIVQFCRTFIACRITTTTTTLIYLWDILSMIYTYTLTLSYSPGIWKGESMSSASQQESDLGHFLSLFLSLSPDSQVSSFRAFRTWETGDILEGEETLKVKHCKQILQVDMSQSNQLISSVWGWMNLSGFSVRWKRACDYI